MGKSVSVVIRARDEAEPLRRILEVLKHQTSPNWEEIEVIVVDNESRDNTVEVVQKYGAKIVNIPRDAFTYPKSMNLGMAAAETPYAVLTVAHAVPQGTQWLGAALKHFNDPTVAAVYGPEIPLKDSTLFEKLSYGWIYHFSSSKMPIVQRMEKMTTLVGVNLIIRKSVWEGFKFDERFENGGEDAQWARLVSKAGYKIIVDRKMRLCHSHHLGLWGLLRYAWLGLVVYRRPGKFNRRHLSFREKFRDP